MVLCLMLLLTRIAADCVINSSRLHLAVNNINQVDRICATGYKTCVNFVI